MDFHIKQEVNDKLRNECRRKIIYIYDPIKPKTSNPQKQSIKQAN